MIVTSASAPMASVPLLMPRIAGRIDRHFFDRRGPIENAGLDELGDDETERGLQTDDAEGGLVQLTHLLLGCVRGVVGADHVDRTVA